MNNKWILKHHIPENPKIRLFCFPFGGSGSSYYMSWSKQFEPDVEIVPVQLPGRENRLSEPPLNEMNSLIAEILPAVQGYLDKPYALFGHSMGAFVSFELARAIRRKNLAAPKLLMASAIRAAHLEETLPPISHLSDEEFIDALKQRYGLGVTEESMELLWLMLPTIRADIFCVENYAYTDEPPFDFPMIGFGGKADWTIKSDQIEGWSYHTTGPFKCYEIDGGHFFVNSERDQLIKCIRDELTDISRNL